MGFKVLVTGLPGVPGWGLFHGLQECDCSVVGLYPPDNQKAAHPLAEPLDGLHPDLESRLEVLFTRHHFDWIVDASGNCALKACECDHALSYQLNFKVAEEIALAAQRHGIPLIRISTDLVYSGQGCGGYREEDPVDPVTIYGKHMAWAEERVQAIHSQCWIFRVPLPMGYTPGGHAGAIDWIEWRFRNRKPATLYYDEIRSVLTMPQVTQIVYGLIAGQWALPTGLYHLGGQRNVSLYQIGQIINVVGNYPAHLLQGCPRLEAGPMPPRAGNVSVNCQKIQQWIPAEMMPAWPADERLVPDSRDWHIQFQRESWCHEDSVSALLVKSKYISQQ